MNYFEGDNQRIKLSKVYNSPQTANMIFEAAETIIEDLNKLLENNKRKIISSISNLKGMKSLFTGDITPYNSPKFISRCGLYVDTTLIEAPFNKLMGISQMDKQVGKELFFKHILNLYELKGSVILDDYQPMALIIPDSIQMELLDEEIHKMTQYDILEYYSLLFDENFLQNEELFNYLEGITNVEDFITNVKNSKLFIPELRSNEDLKKEISNFVENPPIDISKSYPEYNENSFGTRFYLQKYGFFLGNNLSNRFSLKYNVRKSYSAPNPYHIFDWSLRYTEPEIENYTVNNFSLKNIKVVSNLDLEDVISVRKEGILKDFRRELNEGLDIREYDEENLDKVKLQMNERFEELFKMHEIEVNELEHSQKQNLGRFRSFGLGVFMIGYGIFQNDGISLALGAGQVLNKAKMWFDELKFNSQKVSKLSNTPIGLLFHHGEGMK